MRTRCAVALIAALVFAPHAGAKDAPWNQPEAERAAVLALDRALGISARDDAPAPPYRREQLEALLDAMRGESVPAVLRALSVAANWVRDVPVPRDDLSTRLEPAVRSVIAARETATDDASKATTQLARRVLWQIQVRELEDPSARLEFLTRAIDTPGDATLYYSFAAIDQIAALGNEEAERVLRERAVDAATSPVAPEISQRVALGLIKIEVAKRIRAGDSQGLIDLAAVLQAMPQGIRREALAWFVRSLDGAGTPAATAALRGILQREEFGLEIRRQAQRVLQQRGHLGPGERVIELD